MSLLLLFDKYSSGIDSMIIKDNIIQYRDLTETAFHRSFERDKDVLRKLGFEINYINDKWEINSGYEISGVDIWKRIKSDIEVNSLKFLTTYLYLKRIISIDEESSLAINKNNFFKIQKAIDGKYRVSFIYKKEKRIVYPYSFKLYKDTWYLCALDKDKPKTYILNEITELQIGNKKHKKILDMNELPTNFSWENNSKLLKLKIGIDTIRPYYIYRDKFIHRLINIENGENNTYLEIETFDKLGLKNFLLLIANYLTDIEINDKMFSEEINHEL
tara:strand:+ start:707 stop:1528 length:822 start_codon:yes stop_codon:yes gene_type:complete